MDDRQAYSIISSRLQPGEKLLWHGVPSPWAAARGALGLLAFMTLWTGFAAFNFYDVFFKVSGAINKNPSVLLPMTAIFCVIGTVGWFNALRNILNCWRTAYGVTDRRVIIAVGTSGKTQSFSESTLARLSRSENGKTGSLQFDYGRKGRGSGFRHGLYGIPEPARVETLIYQNLIAKPT